MYEILHYNQMKQKKKKKKIVQFSRDRIRIND
jgi:hypothetical protein